MIQFENITSAIDLNDLQTGMYRASVTAVANCLVNAPSNNNGEVWFASFLIALNVVLQVFFKSNTGELYFRNKRTTWSSWKKIDFTEI